MRTLNFIDMFCGAGLFSAGAIRAGLRPTLAIDLCRLAVGSYHRNVAHVGVVGSVLEARQLPPASVLLAGPPCQGFSTLGRRDPLDVRNALVLAVPDWARRCGADVIVVENVPQFRSSSEWACYVSTVRRRGFSVQVWELEAAEHGTPQFRRRSFTVASRIGLIEPPRPRPRARPAGEVISRPITSGDPMHRWYTPTGVSSQRIALVPPCGDKRDILRLAPHLCPPSWSRVGCHATDVWGRLDPDRPANTLRCNFLNPSKGRYLHPTENRTISLREGARLQGVPDEWQFIGRSYPIARQIGNGVPLPLATAVMSAVAKAFGKEKTQHLEHAI